MRTAAAAPVDAVQRLADEQEETGWGPAMSELNPQQRKFVLALVEYPTLSNTKAALAAGYAEGSAHVTGHRLAHNAEVLAAIKEESEARLKFSGILAVSTLTGLMNSNDEKIKLKAAEAVMNRIGMHAVTETKVETHDRSKTDDALIERLTELAGTLGMDKDLLFKSAGIVDAEFREVVPALPAPDEEPEEDW